MKRKVETKVAETPAGLGFRMPAEWERQEATWLGWPHELTDWPGKFGPIPWAFAEIVRHLARVERVILLVENATAELRVRGILKKSDVALDAVTFLRIPTDRGWMRDSGPIAVFDSSTPTNARHSERSDRTTFEHPASGMSGHAVEEPAVDFSSAGAKAGP